MSANESSYALIVDKTTGKQQSYRIGASIKGAKLIQIGKKQTLFEKKGKRFVLKLANNSSINSKSYPAKNPAGYGPAYTRTSIELPYFESVFNKTGPPIDPDALYENLPEFESFESDTGPPMPAY